MQHKYADWLMAVEKRAKQGWEGGRMAAGWGLRRARRLDDFVSGIKMATLATF